MSRDGRILPPELHAWINRIEPEAAANQSQSASLAASENPEEMAVAATTTAGPPAKKGPSILFKLPRELRDMVYRELLVAKNPPVHDRFGRPGRLLGLDPTILRTCEAIYKETHEMLYRDNPLFIETSNVRTIAYIRDVTVEDGRFTIQGVFTGIKPAHKPTRFSLPFDLFQHDAATHIRRIHLDVMFCVRSEPGIIYRNFLDRTYFFLRQLIRNGCLIDRLHLSLYIQTTRSWGMVGPLETDTFIRQVVGATVGRLRGINKVEVLEGTNRTTKESTPWTQALQQNMMSDAYAPADQEVNDLMDMYWRMYSSGRFLITPLDRIMLNAAGRFMASWMLGARSAAEQGDRQAFVGYRARILRDIHYMYMKVAGGGEYRVEGSREAYAPHKDWYLYALYDELEDIGFEEEDEEDEYEIVEEESEESDVSEAE